ncbi:MAG: hypothetical protein ACFFDW_05265 [Candidatus Thorarchaeota archaeon]
MFTKKSKINEEELVLMETQELQEKCGKCEGKLLLKIYWSKEDYVRKIECEKCGMAIWKN